MHLTPTNLWGLLDPGHAHFSKNFKGHVWIVVLGNIPVKFEIRSFECVGSRQQS